MYGKSLHSFIKVSSRILQTDLDLLSSFKETLSTPFGYFRGGGIKETLHLCTENFPECSWLLNCRRGYKHYNKTFMLEGILLSMELQN